MHTPEDGPPSYSVISILFRMGDSNGFLKSFLDAIREEKGKSAEAKKVYFECLLPPNFDL